MKERKNFFFQNYSQISIKIFSFSQFFFSEYKNLWGITLSYSLLIMLINSSRRKYNFFFENSALRYNYYLKWLLHQNNQERAICWIIPLEKRSLSLSFSHKNVHLWLALPLWRSFANVIDSIQLSHIAYWIV